MRVVFSGQLGMPRSCRFREPLARYCINLTCQDSQYIEDNSSLEADLPWKNMEDLSSKGLYVDELQKIRVLDPELSEQTQSLKDECGSFVVQMEDFRKFADGFIALSDEVSKEVEKEQLAALGARNQLKSMEKAREQEQEQLQAIITEKKISLERLRVQYETLRKIETEQQEFIEQLILQQ